jgi:hypothetical protein
VRTKKDTTPEIAISEHELYSLTEELADKHQDTLPKMREGANEVSESIRELTKSKYGRRSFLTKAAALGAGGALLAACGTAASTSTTAAPKVAGPSVDLQVAALAASLENLAVSTYKAGISAATAGKLGTVPPAVANFAETAMAQHADHAKAWNSILVGAGYKAISAPDPALNGVINADLGKVANVVDLAKLALNLEGVAAATYLEALYALSSKSARAIAATIQPVEMQHVAILNFVLGTYPVPNAFATTTGARPAGEAKSLLVK